MNCGVSLVVFVLYDIWAERLFGLEAGIKFFYKCIIAGLAGDSLMENARCDEIVDVISDLLSALQAAFGAMKTGDVDKTVFLYFKRDYSFFVASSCISKMHLFCSVEKTV